MGRACFCGTADSNQHKIGCNAAIRAAWAKYEMVRCADRIEENFRRALAMPGAPGCPGTIWLCCSEILPGDVLPGR